MKKTMNGKDVLLSFLYSPGITDRYNEPIVGRTKLVKMMFLFEEQIYPKFFDNEIVIELPNFEPYYYGPFSKQLVEDVSFFESIGMVVASETNIPISVADEVESGSAEESKDEWMDVSFDDNIKKYEMSYSLSVNGMGYVTEKIWDIYNSDQKSILREFKAQINKISLDALLRYVYQNYPEKTVKSKIANKYL